MKVFSLIALGICAVMFAAPTIADIPHVITYQGRLLDSLGAPLEGEHQMVFTIYTMPEGGEILWTSGSQTVLVDDGLFSYDLGTPTPIPDTVFLEHFERWLGVSVDGGQEMVPRTVFNSVAFAYRAQFADNAGFTEAAGHADHATVAEEAGGAGHALYADTADYAHAAPGGGFTLPYFGATASADPAFSAGNEGTGAGIRGESGSEDGVIGYTGAPDKSGVYGYSQAGIGVAGRSEGNNYGVFGETASSDTLSAGVFAQGPNRGLIARATGPDGIGGYFVGKKTGIRTVLEPEDGKHYLGNYLSIYAGPSAVDSSIYFGNYIRIMGSGNEVCSGVDIISDGAGVNYGLHAEASNTYYSVPDAVNYGVSAKAAGGDINIGTTSSAIGGSSDSLTCGVFSMGANGALNYGGLFYATGNDTNYAVYAEATGGDLDYGIYAKAAIGAGKWAGYFVGDIECTRYIYGAAKFFKIDHPLDPENKYLIHASVESPDQMNVYNGNVITDENGRATVALPDYFEALNTDYRYQLTVIGEFAQAIISEEISNNQFGILTDRSYIKVSWQVTGIRNDASAQAGRVQVELDKPETERGKYIDPEAFGLGEGFGIHAQDYLRRPVSQERSLIDQRHELQGRRERSER